MAKPRAAAIEAPETVASGSPIEGESRQDMLERMIPKLVASCNDDMKSGEVFGRVMERLQHWGASDDEISENVGLIRSTADSYCKTRDAKLADVASSRAAREAQAIGKSLS